jgi:putative membrane protein
MRRAVVTAVLLAAPVPAFAHGQAPFAPGWSFDPWVLAPLLLGGLLFALGWSRLRARSGAGRGLALRRGLAFTAGWLVLAGAVCSPLHEAGGRSFAAHMLEHELIMLAAAPLLVWSRPLAAMIWAFPAEGRQAWGALARAPLLAGLWRGLADPVSATLLQAAVLWLWHAPALFDLALTHGAWHVVQHLSFLVAALLFWSAMLDRRRGVGLAAVCLFLTSMISGGLGAAMALSQSPWYRPYAALGLTPGGLTPAEDQQLAGLLMWIPGGLVHALAALAILAPALRDTLTDKREAPDARPL